MFSTYFTTLDADFLIKLLINTVSITLLVFGCYMKLFSRFRAPNKDAAKLDKGNRDHATSFLLFGIGVYAVTKLLHSAEISMGFAFGLFAVFSMLRYRTESISVKEMTYLFLVIAISLLSAVSATSYLELMLLHVLFLIGASFVEVILSSPSLLIQEVQYEKIDNIKPQNHAFLIEDLKQRTGLNVQSVEIGTIDFLRDTANIRVHYLPLTTHKAPSTLAKIQRI